jgi:hypothetical protein
MPWICPYNSLDLEQRSVLDKLLKATDSQWVRGFAGSGKSVLLILALGELLKINPRATACVVGYTHSLNDMLRSGLPDHAAHIRVVTYLEFCKNPFHCDYIFVDEVQDLDAGSLHVLKAHAGVLMLAGDEEQSIYPDKVSPGDIEHLAKPQIHSLAIVYRLTEKLKQIVASILPGARINAARSARLQANVSITLARAADQQQEFEWVWREALRFTKTGDPVAVLFPGHEVIQNFIRVVCGLKGVPVPHFPKNRYGRYDYESVNQYFEARGMELRYLGNGYGRLDDGEHRRIIYLITYHSAKGLDFDTVFLPALDNGQPLYARDPAIERRLFYVAATRSRKVLNLSYSGANPHPLVQAMPMELLDRIEIKPPTQNGDDADDVPDFF